jgi:hypothetical protein
MTDEAAMTENSGASDGRRKRAIEAYEGARERAADTLGQAPLIALAGGLAAGALLAVLLPKTEAEKRMIRPAARRVKVGARAAAQAARETGAQRLEEMGLTRDKAEATIRNLLGDVGAAAKDSANAALDAARDADQS